MPMLVRHRVHPRHEHLGAIYESGRGRKILEGSLSSPRLGVFSLTEMQKGPANPAPLTIELT